MDHKMMEIDPPTNFPTKDDEIKYWMEIAHEMYQRNETTMHELQEYQENSQYLEKELETSFWESEKKNRDLSQENFKLIACNEELRAKLAQQIAAYAALESEMHDLKIEKAELANNIRNLEQKNDDLERDNRALKMMEEEMESQYNDAIEKIALLETDLLEENYVKFDVERLEKENEELKQEIESIREENRRTDFIRNRKDINHMRSVTQHRSFYSITGSSIDLLPENQREPEDKVNILQDNLVTSSPFKRKVQEDLPIIRVQAARKEKYNTEGRDLSQTFARYNKQQQEKDRNALNRSIELRAKKVKDEEKRQRLLSSFVKRLRSARNQLLRRNE